MSLLTRDVHSPSHTLKDEVDATDVIKQLAKLQNILEEQVELGNLDEPAYKDLYADLSYMAVRRLVENFLQQYDILTDLEERLAVVESRMDRVIQAMER